MSNEVIYQPEADPQCREGDLIGVVGVLLVEIDGELMVEPFCFDDLVAEKSGWFPNCRPATSEEVEWLTSRVGRINPEQQEILDKHRRSVDGQGPK